jgi:hypothetical protein
MPDLTPIEDLHGRRAILRSDPGADPLVSSHYRGIEFSVAPTADGTWCWSVVLSKDEVLRGEQGASQEICTSRSPDRMLGQFGYRLFPQPAFHQDSGKIHGRTHGYLDRSNRLETVSPIKRFGVQGRVAMQYFRKRL